MSPRRDNWGRIVCHCGGYWFPHRKGGGACDHSPTQAIHMARRTGCPEQLLEARIAHAWDHPGKAVINEPCPF